MDGVEAAKRFTAEVMAAVRDWCAESPWAAESRLLASLREVLGTNLLGLIGEEIVVTGLDRIVVRAATYDDGFIEDGVVKFEVTLALDPPPEPIEITITQPE